MGVDYRKYYFSKPTETLLSIYQNNRGKYEDEVYHVIEKLLEERNVNFEKIGLEESAVQDVEIEKKGMIYSPMILGIISLLVTFFSIYNIDKVEADTMLIISAIVITIRCIFLIYCISLCNAYSLHKILWFVLVLIFGGWAMIALNIAILFKGDDEIEEMDIADGINGLTENSAINFEEKQVVPVYTNCPACLKDLMGQNKCDDCDLEFE